ncbi:RecA-superfamily ATPases implicated in signal transduction [Pyrobaculum oguniense TE7]|uniref:RecA-superfamily ATPases implicated in signal transduction n=1 Tax=Pyrobaculum oguniense (strain DSM 13380 / JCM 10595 / TE7) TaxID=698757 RepID=H6QBX6_PYROT|nr:RecA-superfamily ATPases implicated in signal transduction [Pyrobaculum oguniense TE7]
MELDFRGVTAIFGRPGVGKTSLSMRIAHERLSKGDRVLWVSLYEDREALIQNASSLGYDLSKAEIWDMIFIKTDAILNQIVSTVSQSDYGLVVVDSISSIVEGSQSREYLINAVYRVFRPAGIDIIGISEEEAVTPLDYIADNLIRLELKFFNSAAERRMYVLKARGRRAGYYVEFDIIERRGVVFLDELPRPQTKGGWEKYAEAVSRAVGPVRGGNIYLFAGWGLTPLLAKTAADLSKDGAKVLYRVFERDASLVAALVERYGGRVEVQRVEPKPVNYLTHAAEFFETLTKTSADVVISDGLDAEFHLYGDKALELNRKEINELRRLGIALLASVSKDRGLRHISDVAVYVRNRNAVVYSAQGRRECRLEYEPAPHLHC